ncbi:Protein DDI1-like 2 [Acipenser ruthenus]|uniref:Protein DDI1-like 2 n=1 Tax=Acipenser ruthenus TaxID=7906 RepID=A0A444UWH6_ACIRT|nr:Protein DDI1-like 2 [Acipenser ruthenus]
MLVTVFCVRRDRSEITFSLEVSAELELRDFVALCELESGIPASEIQPLAVCAVLGAAPLTWEGRLLDVILLNPA